MISKIPREYIQSISSALVMTGVYLIITTSDPWAGCTMIAIACWALIMNDSILLSKVQFEMQNAMNELRKDQKRETDELLEFLKSSKIASNPMQSSGAAITFLNGADIEFPAFVMSPVMSVVMANKQFTDLLGYDQGELDGKPAARINHKVVMSEVGQVISTGRWQEERSLSLRYVYIHKNSEKIFGNLDVNKLLDGSYLMVFRADFDLVINQDDLTRIMI